MDADSAERAALGVTGPPDFFVNGKFMNDAKPFEQSAKVINEELARNGMSVRAAAGSE